MFASRWLSSFTLLYVPKQNKSTPCYYLHVWVLPSKTGIVFSGNKVFFFSQNCRKQLSSQLWWCAFYAKSIILPSGLWLGEGLKRSVVYLMRKLGGSQKKMALHWIAGKLPEYLTCLFKYRSFMNCATSQKNLWKSSNHYRDWGTGFKF